MKVMPYKHWVNLKENNLHSDDAVQQYKTGVNNDITLSAEDENGIYGVYIEKLGSRLIKHDSAYEDHIKGSMTTEEFIQDIEITKRLMEDFMAYMDRFIKLANSNSKKKE